MIHNVKETHKNKKNGMKLIRAWRKWNDSNLSYIAVDMKDFYECEEC